MLFAEEDHLTLQPVQVKERAADEKLQAAYPVNEGFGFCPQRIVKYLRRGALFIDNAFVHIEDAAGNTAGKLHFVRNNHHGHAFPCQTADNGQHLAHHRRIQSRGGFVKEQNLGFHGQAPGNGNTLLLPARQLVGKIVGFLRQSNHFEQLHGLAVRLGPFLF